MKNLFIILFLYTTILMANETKYTKYVNPFIGTGSMNSLSLSGSNFPGACYPFGMVKISPDTKDNPEDPCSGYDYADSTIVGFSQTHLSGTGVADLFDFLFMPYTEKIRWNPFKEEDGSHGYYSKFSHKNEMASPGYYRVKLDDYNILAEFTVTEHCGYHKYTFDENSQNRFLIVDFFHSLDKKRPYWKCNIIESQIKIINDSTIEGYRLITGWAPLRKIYFKAVFSQPVKNYYIKAYNKIYTTATVVNSRNLKTVFEFDNKNSNIIAVKIALSSVSYEGARKNFKEIAQKDFKTVKKETEQKWENELSCIDIKADKDTKTIFYTGLYHALIHPDNIADIDSTYLDQNFVERKAEDGKHYSTFSLWDTFRALHPLLTLIKPQKDVEFINSMLRQYIYWGYLPIWQLWGSETYCMIGNHAIPVIVDAFIKNLQGFDKELAYKAIKKSSLNSHINSPFEILDKYEYIPEDLNSQSVSITLEIAFDDWCVAQMAKKLGYKKDFEYFKKRSLYYKNLFDEKTRFFRAKNSKGEWITPFNPLLYGGNGDAPFTEGNAWQYLWFVPHDVYNFIKLMGGDKEFEAKLDTFFTLSDRPENINGNASGFIGQYAHGNEPSHHIIYLYNYCGAPWKTEFYVNKVLKEQYKNAPAGYSGNEDCGQMSAWFILSALGFYPVNPASGVYVFGSPYIDNAILNLPHNKKFEIVVHNRSDKNIYIEKIMLNGQKYKKLYITHKDITQGGKLEFFMTDTPPKEELKNYERPIEIM